MCALSIDFSMDEHLLSEIERHNCVIFAGAGISTETSDTHPDTLYDQLRHQIKCEDYPQFWELVDRFEAQPNGRQKLIELVKDRFGYINGFRDLRQQATRFHRALGNAPYFKSIITTNWDRYFEDVIEATPFVYDSDIPLWDTAKRPVIKIHGSIDNYSSLVASSEDYKFCENRLREGALGAVVKQIFATKTCILCGYSAKDPDFQSIFRTIQDGLGRLARTHYLISPYVTDDEAEQLRSEFGIVAIRTDATHFLRTTKSHMESKYCFASDDSFEAIVDDLIGFHETHMDFVDKADLKLEPHLIFAISYQDGVIHALQRLIDRRMTGDHSDLHRVQGQISKYEEKIESYRKDRNYWDVAYFTGYRNGLIRLVLLNSKIDDDPPSIPECYHPGIGEIDLEEYDNLVRKNPEIHKGALREARRRTSDLGEGIVVQHLPWG